ncbi:hypothetical protein PI125_g25517, partial [Phytophthora idaei]
MVQISLECAIVCHTGTFDVKIDDGEKVSALKDAIKWKNEDIKGPARDLQLFLAKTDDGAWLRDVDPGVLELEEGRIHPDVQTLIDGEKMKVRWTINDVLKENHMPTPQSRQVHVLVVVPGDAGVGVASVEPSALPTAMHRHPERLKRWAAINEMIRQKNQEGN